MMLNTTRTVNPVWLSANSLTLLNVVNAYFWCLLWFPILLINMISSLYGNSISK